MIAEMASNCKAGKEDRIRTLKNRKRNNKCFQSKKKLKGDVPGRDGNWRTNRIFKFGWKDCRRKLW